MGFFDSLFGSRDEAPKVKKPLGAFHGYDMGARRFYDADVRASHVGYIITDREIPEAQRRRDTNYIFVNSETKMPIYVSPMNFLEDEKIKGNRSDHGLVVIDSNIPVQVSASGQRKWILWEVVSGNGHTIETSDPSNMVLVGRNAGGTTVVNHSGTFSVIPVLKGGKGDDVFVTGKSAIIEGNGGADTVVVVPNVGRDGIINKAGYTIEDFNPTEGDRICVRNRDVEEANSIVERVKSGQLTIESLLFDLNIRLQKWNIDQEVNVQALPMVKDRDKGQATLVIGNANNERPLTNYCTR